MSDFNIDEYNKQFEEKNKGYNKVCREHPCEHIDKCIKSGFCLFCFCDDERKELYYLPGKKDSGDVFTFKNTCLRDDFPQYGINISLLNKIREYFEEKYTNIIIPPIEELIKELKEIGKFRES